MSNIAGDIKIRILITFDENTFYEIDNYVYNPSKTIVSLNSDEDESINSGNPIGIMTSNSINFSIIDLSGVLNISKKDGPYYKKIKNGLKVDIYTLDGEAEKLYGTYYTTDWGTPYSYGTSESTNISGKDKLNYIANKEIPKLPIYSGIPIGDLIKQVFEGIGITKDEYYIDPRLNLDLLFGITVGSKIRDFLNLVSNALVARVVLSRDGIIKIVPALQSYGNQYRISDNYITSIHSKNNSSGGYNKVRVHYKKPGNSEFDIITSINGIYANAGNNKIENIAFDRKVLSIDQVEFTHENSDIDLDDVIDNISWTAYQNGIDISFVNNSASEIKDITVRIYGCILNEIEMSEEANIENSDNNTNNVLEIQNDIIQDAVTAKNLAVSLSEYIQKTDNVWEVDTQLTPEATTGDRLIIDSTNRDFNGNYKIISCSTNLSTTNYNKRLTLILEDIVNVWDDTLMWDDTGYWED